jgi:hypothetical protein
MDDESKLARVGTWFHTEVDGVIFRGAVMSYDPPYYEIVYEDGDVEEMSLTDLKKLLATDRQRIRVAEREQAKKETGANRDELKVKTRIAIFPNWHNDFFFRRIGISSKATKDSR